MGKLVKVVEIVTELDDRHMKAIQMKIEGATNGEIADILGVTRKTIWDWFTNNPVVIVELNQRRKDRADASIDMLDSVMTKAVRHLASIMEDENGDFKDKPHIRMQAAMALMNKLAPSRSDLNIHNLSKEQMAEKGIDEALTSVIFDAMPQEMQDWYMKIMVRMSSEKDKWRKHLEINKIPLMDQANYIKTHAKIEDAEDVECEVIADTKNNP